MAFRRRRTRPLHNFDLPELRWANQRLLPCIKLPSSAADHRRLSPDSGSDFDSVRERLMLDLRAAADQIKRSVLKDDGDVKPRPWNLRTRRAACRAPAEKDSECSPQKSSRLGSESLEAEGPVRFSVQLTKAEIEEDFRAMAGVRPPRRPKKRAKTVQRELDHLFPGLWLTEITPEMYKVDEATE